MRGLVLLLVVPLLSGCLDDGEPEPVDLLSCTADCPEPAVAPPEPDPLNGTDAPDAPHADNATEPDGPRTACELADCRVVTRRCDCWEPTMAVLDGDAWVVPAREDTAWVEGEDGFGTVDLPALPSGLGRADGLVQTLDGVLYYSALVHDGKKITGVQVAAWDADASDWAWAQVVDGPTVVTGRTCTVPIVGIGCSDATVQVRPDRQWLLARGDSVWLFFQGHGYSAPFVARGGADGFEAPRPLTDDGTVPINGRPVDADGTLVWPMFLGSGGGNRLVVLRSDDGAAWSEVEVVAPGEDGYAGQWFPAVAAVDSRVLVAYRDLDDALWLVRSDDAGATWSAPFSWDESPGVASPWLEATDDAWVLGWYTDTDPARFMLGLLSAEVPLENAESLRVPLLLDAGASEEGIRRTHTDFAHLVVDDGAVWWTWTDAGAGLAVAGPLR